MGIVGVIIQGGLIRRLSKMMKEKTLLFVGMAALMIGLALLPYVENFMGVSLVVVVLSIGTGILQPTLISLVSKYAPNDVQGAVLGFNSSVSSLARVFCPVWGGFAFQVLGYEAPFITGAIFTLITILLTIYLLKSSKLKLN